MDEETSDDELPSISLSQDSSTKEVVMPSAKEIAVERARERRTEMELQRLREMETHSPPPGAPPRSDSSGSEGEAALAAAVRALRVLPPPAPAPRAPHAAVARRLLMLLPAPSHALHEFIAAFADDASTTVLRKLINRMVHSISCALSCEYNAFTADELVTCAGVLSASCLAAPRPAPPARRALHRALQHAQPHRAVAARLAHLAATAASDACGSDNVRAARALLALSDAARGGGLLAHTLAALLGRQALHALLTPTGNTPATPPPDQEPPSAPLSASELHDLLTSSAGGWKKLTPAGRHVALRLVARALRAQGGAGEGGSGGTDSARVLQALAHPHQQDKQHPDYLKVVVAASTLQLLFRAPHAHT